ncbi:MAG TPA: HTH domain-containing protein [Geobacteraceae bacterium]
MNKLDVALKLIKLLNERKRIDSRTVAEELGVSIRTAQRYLLDLSSLPCVVVDEEAHGYALASDYKLRDALLLGHEEKATTEFDAEEILGGELRVHEFVCVVCGHRQGAFLGVPLPSSPGGRSPSARQALNRLAFFVRNRLKARKCGFP